MTARCARARPPVSCHKRGRGGAPRTRGCSESDGIMGQHSTKEDGLRKVGQRFGSRVRVRVVRKCIMCRDSFLFPSASRDYKHLLHLYNRLTYIPLFTLRASRVGYASYRYTIYVPFGKAFLVFAARRRTPTGYCGVLAARGASGSRGGSALHASSSACAAMKACAEAVTWCRAASTCSRTCRSRSRCACLPRLRSLPASARRPSSRFNPLRNRKVESFRRTVLLLGYNPRRTAHS